MTTGSPTPGDGQTPLRRLPKQWMASIRNTPEIVIADCLVGAVICALFYLVLRTIAVLY